MADVRGAQDVRAQGQAAIDIPISGDPLLTGGRASVAVPTSVSTDGDAQAIWLARSGALFTAILPSLGIAADPYTQVTKTAQYTTTQTGTALWTPGGGKKICLTAYQIQVGGTTAGTLQLWYEASNGNTTYVRNTDDAVFDGEFAPSATLKPGVVQTGVWLSPIVDSDLRVTTSAAINPLTITVWGYEF